MEANKKQQETQKNEECNKANVTKDKTDAVLKVFNTY